MGNTINDSKWQKGDKSVEIAMAVKGYNKEGKIGRVTYDSNCFMVWERNISYGRKE